MSGAEHVEALLKHKAAGNECYKNKDYAGAIAAYGEAAKLLPRFPYDDDSDDEGGPSAAEIVAKMDPELLKQGAVRGCRTPKARRICHTNLLTCADKCIHTVLFARSLPPDCALQSCRLLHGDQQADPGSRRCSARSSLRHHQLESSLAHRSLAHDDGAAARAQ